MDFKEIHYTSSTSWGKKTMKFFLLWVGQGSNGEWCKYCHVSYTSSPKNTNFFICGPISTYGSSFCRSKYLKQLLPHTFFSNTNISPSQGPSFANLPCLRIMRTGKMTKSQKIQTFLLVDQFKHVIAHFVDLKERNNF